MTEQISELENNISLHYIYDNKYKSNYITICLTMPLERKTVTINSMIASLLKRGTNRLNNMQDIEKEMEQMYGSTLDVNIDKIGKNYIFKFYIESIKDEFVNENIFEKSIQNISEMILTPYLENGLFKYEYFIQEKNNLKLQIDNKINDKSYYAKTRIIEEMFDKDNYGMYVYGYTEDIKNITNASIYNQYLEVLKTAKIDVYALTNKEECYVKEKLNMYLNSDMLKQRKNIYEPKISTISSQEDPKYVTEELDVNQGKLVLGYDIPNIQDVNIYNILVWNAILGEGCNSKMFRNVREKEHLAYSASSSYIKGTNIVLISTGIELSNYEKAVKIIKKQVDDLKNGVISKKEFSDAKKTLVSSYMFLNDAQYRLINFYIRQNLLGDNTNIDSIISNIEEVKLKDVINLGKKVKINTIYYLTNRKEETYGNI